MTDSEPKVCNAVVRCEQEVSWLATDFRTHSCERLPRNGLESGFAIRGGYHEFTRRTRRSCFFQEYLQVTESTRLSWAIFSLSWVAELSHKAFQGNGAFRYIVLDRNAVGPASGASLVRQAVSRCRQLAEHALQPPGRDRLGECQPQPEVRVAGAITGKI